MSNCPELFIVGTQQPTSISKIMTYNCNVSYNHLNDTKTVKTPLCQKQIYKKFVLVILIG